MKKKLIILLLCIGSVILPSMARADMGAPEMISYDVVVTNKDGAKDADSDTVIPYDTVCKVNYESLWEGKLTLEVDCEGFENNYSIDGEDVRILKDEYQPTSEEKLESPVKYYIYKDIEMYSGPSYKYKKIGQSIPAGSIVTVTYADTDVVWGYTEYNGKKGWVYIYWHDVNNQIARVIEKADEKKLVTVRNITELHKYPNDAFNAKEKNSSNNDAIKVSIPAGTILNAEYYYPILKEDGLFYVEYNGIKGWIDSYDGVAVRSKGSVLVLNPKDIKVYDEKYKSAKIDISKYQEFTYNYKATFYEKNKDTLVYAITYDKKDYFLEIKFNSEDDLYTNEMLLEAYSSRVEVLKNAPLYETYEGKKEMGTINKGAKMDRDYSKYSDELDTSMYYIKTPDMSGWVQEEYVDTESYKEGEEMADIISAPFTTTTLVTTGSNKTTKAAENNTKEHMSTKEIVTICVIGAIVLALVIVVVIVLINRKKKTNTEELLDNSTINEANVVADDQEVTEENKEIIEENTDNTDENASLK